MSNKKAQVSVKIMMFGQIIEQVSKNTEKTKSNAFNINFIRRKMQNAKKYND